MFQSFLGSVQKPMLFLLAGLLGCAGAPGKPADVAAPEAAAQRDAVAAPAAASPALPFDPSVTTGALGNGLRYYVKRQKPKDQRVQLLLVVKAGSLHEED